MYQRNHRIFLVGHNWNKSPLLSTSRQRPGMKAKLPTTRWTVTRTSSCPTFMSLVLRWGTLASQEANRCFSGHGVEPWEAAEANEREPKTRQGTDCLGMRKLMGSASPGTLLPRTQKHTQLEKPEDCLQDSKDSFHWWHLTPGLLAFSDVPHSSGRSGCLCVNQHILPRAPGSPLQSRDTQIRRGGKPVAS